MFFNNSNEINLIYKKTKSLLQNRRTHKQKIDSIIKVSHLWQNLQNYSNKKTGQSLINFQHINPELLKQLSNDEVIAVYQDLKNTFKGSHKSKKKKLGLFDAFLLKNKKFLQLVNILYADNPPQPPPPPPPPPVAPVFPPVIPPPPHLIPVAPPPPPVVVPPPPPVIVVAPPVTPRTRPPRPLPPPLAPETPPPKRRKQRGAPGRGRRRTYVEEDDNEFRDSDLVDYDEELDQKNQEQKKREQKRKKRREKRRKKRLKKKYQNTRKKIDKMEKDEDIYEDDSDDESDEDDESDDDYDYDQDDEFEDEELDEYEDKNKYKKSINQPQQPSPAKPKILQTPKKPSTRQKPLKFVSSNESDYDDIVPNPPKPKNVIPQIVSPVPIGLNDDDSPIPMRQEDEYNSDEFSVPGQLPKPIDSDQDELDELLIHDIPVSREPPSNVTNPLTLSQQQPQLIANQYQASINAPQAPSPPPPGILQAPENYRNRHQLRREQRQEREKDLWHKDPE